MHAGYECACLFIVHATVIHNDDDDDDHHHHSNYNNINSYNNNDNSPGSCREDCTTFICGDGIIDMGEACDDGNTDNTDDCLTGCEHPFCGDGFTHSIGVFPHEYCDDGGNDNCSGTCNASCDGLANTCGDGVVRCGEECEAGDLQGQDCTDFGYSNAAGLQCSTCLFDTTSCT